MVDVGLGEGSPSGAAFTPPAEMSFAWPAVTIVHETALKQGTESETRYELHRCPRKNGRGFVFRQHGFRLVSLGGLPREHPEVKPLAPRVEALGAAFPHIVVDEDGSLIDVRRFQEVVAASIAQLSNPQSRAVLERMKDNPRLEEMLKAKVGEIWFGWVGAWALYEPRDEARQLFTMPELEVAGEGAPDLELWVDRKGTEGPKLELELIQREGKERLKALLANVMPQLLPADASKKAMADFIAATSISRETTYRVRTDVRTLFPETASRHQIMELSLPGKEPRRREERNEYRFEAAEGREPVCD